jgi:hypothetical protein
MATNRKQVEVQIRNTRYKLNGKAWEVAPRTNGEAGQASNTQAAWEAVLNCVVGCDGIATYSELSEALQAAGLQFKNYVPYFVRKCGWLERV